MKKTARLGAIRSRFLHALKLRAQRPTTLPSVSSDPRLCVQPIFTVHRQLSWSPCAGLGFWTSPQGLAQVTTVLSIQPRHVRRLGQLISTAAPPFCLWPPRCKFILLQRLSRRCSRSAILYRHQMSTRTRAAWRSAMAPPLTLSSLLVFLTPSWKLQPRAKPLPLQINLQMLNYSLWTGAYSLG